MKCIILSCGLSICSFFAVAQWNTSNNNIYNSNSGNVGVGTGSTVNAKLEVRGPSIRLSDTNGDVRYLEISQDADGTAYGRNWTNVYAGAREFKISGFSHLPGNDGSTKKDIIHFDGYNLLLLKDNGGNIGIGTTKPDFKLTVNGKVKCEEVQVVVDVPADYVFDVNYMLMPLSEVQKFILENRHLPNVPSAQEIKQKGWQVGEMNNKLLEKVEELTLYLLQLKEENEKLRARVDALESQTK